jgi:hypothetical protein
MPRSGKALPDLRYGVTTTDGGDFGPEPRLFLADTVHVYFLPCVSPMTVSGLFVPTFDLARPLFDDTHAAV